MQTVLLAIGAIAAAVGVFTIGFGFEIYDFSFGNTLIIAGTISLIGGIVTVGIAIAVRELTRVADAVAARPPSRGAVQGEPTDLVGPGTNPRRGSGNRATLPPKGQSETSGRDSRPTEPRSSHVRSGTDLDDSVAPRAHQNVYPLVRPVSGSIDQQNNVASSRPAPVRAGAAMRVQSKSGTQITEVQEIEPPRVVVSTEPHQLDRTRANSFDSVWPADAKHGQFVNAAVARELPSEPDAGVTAPTADLMASRSSGERHPASVLKSGVIDGMVYTLYVDGSIEAQLAQTTVHFNSIEELQQHLENVARS